MSGRSWDHNGKSDTRRGYGRRHAKLRRLLLGQEPLCRLCKQKTPPHYTPATIADHVVSIAKGGAIHDIDNLQPVCEPCHREKGLRERGYRVKPTFGPDGWRIDD